MILNDGTPEEEVLTLIRGKRVETSRNSGFSARFAGLYVFIDTDIGVTLQWDKGTHIIVKVTGKHSGKVEGLCGNYDQDSRNDLQTSGGCCQQRIQSNKYLMVLVKTKCCFTYNSS